jgi:fatty acid-binding protein DegV
MGSTLLSDKNPRGIEKEKTLASSATVAIVTGSAAGIPTNLLDAFNIHVVPYYVHLGEESYISGVDITPETFFKRLRATDPNS